MDSDTKTQQLTAKVTELRKLVTIQALALIMGVSQSPAYLSIAFQDLAKKNQTNTYNGSYSTCVTWMINK